MGFDTNKFKEGENIKITNDTLSRIEEIFGFKLYGWQRDYIKGSTDTRIGGRRNGNTFAYCIRLLLSEDRGDIKWSDVLMWKYSDEWHDRNYQRWFIGYLRDINDKLTQSRFETNLVMEPK